MKKLYQLATLTTAESDALAALSKEANASPWSAASYRASLEQGHQMVGAQTPEGELLGFLVWSVVCEEAEVLDLAVTTAARRQRIAHALLAACMEAASQQGAERVLLEVRAGDTGAQAFYAAEGFQPLARRKAYYPAAHPSAAREDALILVRPL